MRAPQDYNLSNWEAAWYVHRDGLRTRATQSEQRKVHPIGKRSSHAHAKQNPEHCTVWLALLSERRLELRAACRVDNLSRLTMTGAGTLPKWYKRSAAHSPTDGESLLTVVGVHPD